MSFNFQKRVFVRLWWTQNDIGRQILKLRHPERNEGSLMNRETICSFGRGDSPNRPWTFETVASVFSPTE
jgi:hypothetical protein